MPCASPRDGSWPCGKCYGCLRVRREEAVTRNLLEWQEHGEGSFVTLTIDDDHVALTPGGFMTLSKEQWAQGSIAIRRALEKAGFPWRPYGNGEYSPALRPHFHLLLHGVPPRAEPLIEQAWKYGHVNVGRIETKSIAYVAKHAIRGIKPGHPGAKEVTPEWLIFGRKPGIGYGAVERLSEALLKRGRAALEANGDIPEQIRFSDPTGHRKNGRMRVAGYLFKRKFREACGIPVFESKRPRVERPPVSEGQRSKARWDDMKARERAAKGYNRSLK